MKRLLAALIGLSALLAAVGADEGPATIRVLSYNIHHGRGADGVVDLGRIAAVIEAADPDVVALQEVDRGVARTDRIDEPAELARLTGMTAVFERNITYQGGDYGNALLTRLPIVRSRNVHLPSYTENEQRGVLVVDLEGPGDSGPIRVFATHLDYHPPDRERLASADLINELADEYPERPSVLMGDLNASPDGEVLSRFDASWTRANAGPIPTYPAEGPSKQIDYVLLRPADRWRVVEVRVLDEPAASDHRPILAVLEAVAEGD